MQILKVLFLLCFIGMYGQNGTIGQIPEYNFPKIKSSITMPVNIPLAEISNLVNASVKDLIYQDNSYTDNDNDHFKVKVWKTKNIRLVGDADENILIEVPLKVWAEKGIGTLGLYTYQETNFEAVMYFKTTLNFKNNWSVSTFTQPMGFKWVTKPVLDYGRIKIPITSFVEKSLKEEQYKFCKTIDAQMATQLDFQQYAVLAWNAFAQPFNISEEYKTWLKITPINVNLTPLKLYGNEIYTTMGINIFSETFTGSKPASTPPVKSVMDFNVISSLKNQFLLQTTANISFDEATAIAERMFLNKSYEVRGDSVKISDIKVYGEENRVIIEAKTEGYINGTTIISGIPVYDGIKKKIILTETKFKLKTMNIIQKTATLLFRGKIIKTIEQEYGIPTAEMEDSSRKSIEEAFNKEYYKGLKISGKVLNLKPSKITATPSGIAAVIDTNATLKLTLKGF